MKRLTLNIKYFCPHKRTYLTYKQYYVTIKIYIIKEGFQMWYDDDDKIMNIQNNIEKECFPAECPVCGKRAGHLYFHRHRTGYERGGVWTWCSECCHSSHASCCVPEWWDNPEFIDFGKLTALPDYLEGNKVHIDKWFNILTNKDV